MCVRPVLLYGAETWALTQQLTKLLEVCDRRMLRYIAAVRWRDRVNHEEVLNLCSLVDLGKRIRQQRLRWFGHVRRAKDKLIGKVEALKVEGRRGGLGRHGTTLRPGGYPSAQHQ